MSPVSLMKVIDPGARVQVPFTLSVTRTCSGASNWEIHPTSRSPRPTGLVSVTVIVETRDPVENAAPWTKAPAVDWATAGRGSRTPRVAITARSAVDRADGLLCETCSTVAGPAGGGETSGGTPPAPLDAALQTTLPRPPPPFLSRAH